MSAGPSSRCRSPYVERPIRQRRPALVVLTGLGVAQDLLWVLMITAAANRGWPDDVTIDDHAAAGLPIPSIVRTVKIATIVAADARPLGILPARRPPASQQFWGSGCADRALVGDWACFPAL